MAQTTETTPQKKNYSIWIIGALALALLVFIVKSIGTSKSTADVHIVKTDTVTAIYMLQFYGTLQGSTVLKDHYSNGDIFYRVPTGQGDTARDARGVIMDTVYGADRKPVMDTLYDKNKKPVLDSATLKDKLTIRLSPRMVPRLLTIPSKYVEETKIPPR